MFSFPSLSGRGSGVQGPSSHGSCSPPHPPFPVRYRVFALDQKMRPATDILTVMVEVSRRPLTFLWAWAAELASDRDHFTPIAELSRLPRAEKGSVCSLLHLPGQLFDPRHLSVSISPSDCSLRQFSNSHFPQLANYSTWCSPELPQPLDHPIVSGSLAVCGPLA